MKVAVITPYHKEEKKVLTRCCQSVADQTHHVTHILVADGFPSDVPKQFLAEHIVLSKPHRDFGDTPRLMGSLSAMAQGFDAICFLDADCWFEKDHVETLVSLYKKSGADVITATRMLRKLDESILGVCTESDGKKFNDTNCYFISRKAYGVLPVWVYKEPCLAVVGDRVFWGELKKKHTTFHSLKPTVNYTTIFTHHYVMRNEIPPKGSKIITSVLDNGVFKSYVYDEVRQRLADAAKINKD